MHPPRSRALRLAGGTLFVIMLGLTACGLDTSVNRFAFSRTSGEYMMSIVSGSAVVQGLLLLGVGYGLYRVAQRSTSGWTALVVIVALCWGLSGRKVGVALWDEGRVYMGWFCIQTDQFTLCSPTEDCETALLHTSVTPLPFWRVRLANAHGQRSFFIGPVTWTPTLRMLRQAFGPSAEK
jgi:hypothetical protein